MSANRLYKQGFHTGGTQELQQLAVNTYWRGSPVNGAQAPYPGGERGIPKSAEQLSTGYIPNGAFPASDANRLQDYYAQGSSSLYSPFNAMNGFPNGSQKNCFPPPPPYESHTQITSPQQSCDLEEKTLDGQNYWGSLKVEDQYEQPTKRLRMSSNEDLKSASE